MTYNPRQVTYPHGASICSSNQQDNSTNFIGLFEYKCNALQSQQDAFFIG